MKIKSIASSSQGCCYIIEYEKFKLILECGISIKKVRKALDFDFSNVVGCFVSHEHGDHAKYLKKLELETPIKIWCSKGTKKQFQLYECNTISKNKIIKPGGTFVVFPVQLSHDVECFGFVIACGENVLFYVTDTSELPQNKIVGLTHLMIEANHSFENMIKSDHFHARRAFDNHLDIDSVVEFCKIHQKTLQEVHLIHLSDQHSDADLFQSMVAQAIGIPVFIAEKSCSMNY